MCGGDKPQFGKERAIIKSKFYERLDRVRYNRILNMQDDDKKEFFDKDGCGLEIEFGVVYERRCRSYIETGLRKMKEFVGNRGKFVPDSSIGSFLNVEIVLNPFLREDLKPIFDGIVSIISFYENFVFNDTCGIHANFRADEGLKETFYNLLSDGRYDSERFSHSKYKIDFMAIVNNPDGTKKSYREYVEYQNRVGAKYCGINFLKDNLIEARTLSLSWDDVTYFYDIYDEAKEKMGI